MQTLLRENECQSNPCQNGGTCEDLYNAYQCHCPSNWEVCERTLTRVKFCENNYVDFLGPELYDGR